MPGGDVYTLVLHDALENKDLEILIPRQGDRWGTALALTPRWNQSSHDVDLSELRLRNGKLAGRLKISLHPNATWPFPGRLPEAVVEIDAEVEKQTVTGRFKSVFDGVVVVGDLDGSVRPSDPRLLENCDVELRLEKATPIEADGWQRGASLRIVWRGGKATAGQVLARPSDVPPAKSVARVDFSRVRITAGTITGEVESTAPGDPTVHFGLGGVVVGEQVGGACEVSIGGRTEQLRMRGEIRVAAETLPSPSGRGTGDKELPSPSGRGAGGEGGQIGTITHHCDPLAEGKGDELDQRSTLPARPWHWSNASAARPQLAAELRELERLAKTLRRPQCNDSSRPVSTVLAGVPPLGGIPAKAGTPTDNHNSESLHQDRTALYEAVRGLRRQIILSHPALDFDRLLINKRSTELPEHMVDQYLGRYSKAGPGLVVLESWKDKPTAIALTADRLPPGALLHPNLSFDGKRVLFAFCDHSASTRRELRASLHLRDGPGDGHGPPGHRHTGRFAARARRPADRGRSRTSTRVTCPTAAWPSSRRGARRSAAATACRYSPSFALYRGELDGTNIRPLSFNEANDWGPSYWPTAGSSTPAGTISIGPMCFFWVFGTVRPDGTGNRPLLQEQLRLALPGGRVRAIAGSHKVVATAAAHHGQTLGSIVLVDPRKGQDGGASADGGHARVAFPGSPSARGHDV